MKKRTMDKILRFHAAASVFLAVSPNAQRFVSTGADGMVRIHSTQKRKMLGAVKQNKAGTAITFLPLVFSFDYNLLMTSLGDRSHCIDIYCWIY
jgi:hypothetical protein